MIDRTPRPAPFHIRSTEPKRSTALFVALSRLVLDLTPLQPDVCLVFMRFHEDSRRIRKNMYDELIAKDGQRLRAEGIRGELMRGSARSLRDVVCTRRDYAKRGRENSVIFYEC